MLAIYGFHSENIIWKKIIYNPTWQCWHKCVFDPYCFNVAYKVANLSPYHGWHMFYLTAPPPLLTCDNLFAIFVFFQYI